MYNCKIGLNLHKPKIKENSHHGHNHDYEHYHDHRIQDKKVLKIALSMTLGSVEVNIINCNITFLTKIADSQ